MSLTNKSFSSANKTDKIVGVYEGSFNIASAPSLFVGTKYTNFSHGFNRPVFTKLLWSTDNATWNDGGSGSFPNAGIAYSTSSDIYVLTLATSGTLYYRVIAFWIDDYDTSNPSVPNTISSQSGISFDSRLNYQKIFLADSYSDAFGSGATTETIHHGLGYEPNVRVFIEALPGEVWPANFGGTKNLWKYSALQIEADIEVSTEDLRINVHGYVGSPTRNIWYVIYLDSAE